MRPFTCTFLLVIVSFTVALCGLTACYPALNWREIRPENTRLSVLMPCKPDKAQKTVPLGGRQVNLSMLGCDAGEATFAITVADMGEVGNTADAAASARLPAEVLAQWQAATLVNMKAVATGAAGVQVLPLKLPGSSDSPAAVLVKATGQRANGTAVQGQAAYFVQGKQAFQAVMYAPTVQADAAETFFSGLKFE
ncbi:MAG: hypothetical protein H7Z77_05635 [Chitinophagaceae bacterium]|nr:hypothetical protein [Polaromonas sp.]